MGGGGGGEGGLGMGELHYVPQVIQIPTKCS